MTDIVFKTGVEPKNFGDLYPGECFILYNTCPDDVYVKTKPNSAKSLRSTRKRDITLTALPETEVFLVDITKVEIALA